MPPATERRASTVTTPRSRRRLLRGAAGLAGAGAAIPAAASDPELSVMTRTLYVGVDLFRLFGVEDRRELRAHPFAARLDASAAEIARTDPDADRVPDRSTGDARRAAGSTAGNGTHRGDRRGSVRPPLEATRPEGRRRVNVRPVPRPGTADLGGAARGRRAVGSPKEGRF